MPRSPHTNFLAGWQQQEQRQQQQQRQRQQHGSDCLPDNVSDLLLLLPALPQQQYHQQPQPAAAEFESVLLPQLPPVDAAAAAAMDPWNSGLDLMAFNCGGGEAGAAAAALPFDPITDASLDALLAPFQQDWPTANTSALMLGRPIVTGMQQQPGGSKATARRKGRGGRPRKQHNTTTAAGQQQQQEPQGVKKKSGRGPKPKYIFGTEEEAADARRERNRKAALDSYYK